MTLKDITCEAIENFIREQIPQEKFEEFLEIIITEDNILEYAKFFHSLYKKDEEKGKLENTKEENFYAFLRLFLLYNEVITIEQANNKDIDNNVILKIALAELHFYEANDTVELNFREFVRDHLIQVYYADGRKQGYKDQKDLEDQLSTIIYGNKNGKYLVRYNNIWSWTKPSGIIDFKLKEKSDWKVSAECESEYPIASRYLNNGSKHLQYIANLTSESEFKLIDFDGTKKTIKFDNNIKNDYYRLNEIIVSDISFKDFSKKIHNKTIHYTII